MEDYQKRVVDEKEALDIKIKALIAFVDSKATTLSPINYRLLYDQLRVMGEYNLILQIRIASF